MFCFEEHCCSSFQCSVFNDIITLFSFVILPSWQFREVNTLLKEQNHPFSRRMEFQQPTRFYGETSLGSCSKLQQHDLDAKAVRPRREGIHQEPRVTRTMAAGAQYSKPTTEFNSVQLSSAQTPGECQVGARGGASRASTILT